jgi:hypothetical protein
MVVVAESSAADVVELLGKAGAFPIVEATWAQAASAIAEIQPAALLLADARIAPEPSLSQAAIKAIEGRGGPFMPVLARAQTDSNVAIPFAIPIAADEPKERLIARVRSALRVRTLHATVLRRAGSAQAQKLSPLPRDLLDNATVLCVGRGRSYPALTTAIGERTGLIGTFTIEAAARYLNARDIDGIVVGDGLGARVVEALLSVLGDDARFRDLPVGVLGTAPVDDARLPNLIRLDSNPEQLVSRLVPLVRLQAFESHLKRVLKSLESEGIVDPETGLLARDAFWRDLERTVQDAENGGSALTIARFAFESIDRRSSLVAARLFSRLGREVDFACPEPDGTILAAFTDTDLRSAHVVARRIASILKHTMLSPDGDSRTIRPSVTLATLKPTDNLSTLVARIGTYPQVAAG